MYSASPSFDYPIHLLQKRAQVTEGKVLSEMENCEAAICQTYAGGIPLYILYLEQSFYITLEEVDVYFMLRRVFDFVCPCKKGAEEQSLLDMSYQDVSARGACFSVLTYDPEETGPIRYIFSAVGLNFRIF